MSTMAQPGSTACLLPIAAKRYGLELRITPRNAQVAFDYADDAAAAGMPEPFRPHGITFENLKRRCHIAAPQTTLTVYTALGGPSMPRARRGHVLCVERSELPEEFIVVGGVALRISLGPVDCSVHRCRAARK
jgi:hypothetical protein